jgi:hypothetical protein
MAKVAKLVTVSFTTRVIVEDTASDEEIIEASRGKVAEKVINELQEHLESIEDDTEMPYEEGEELRYNW